MAKRVTDYKRYLNQKEKLIRKRVDYLRGEKLFGNFSQKREAKNLLINFPVSTNPQYWEKLPCMLALFYNIQCKISRLMLYENFSKCQNQILYFKTGKVDLVIFIIKLNQLG